MTSAHGNKILIGSVCACFIILAFLFGEILSSRKAQIRLFEKKYSEAVSSLEAHNREIEMREDIK